MTTIKYLTSPDTGCCTTAELIALSRTDKSVLETLKRYAAEEMRNKGIEVTDK